MLFHFGGTRLGDLIDHGGWQQFFLGAQLQQELAIDGMYQTFIAAWRNPALRLHVQAGAGRECLRCEVLFELVGGNGPRCGETVNLKVLEPHGSRGQKGAFYTQRQALLRMLLDGKCLS